MFAFDQQDDDYELELHRSPLASCDNSTQCELDESCASGLCTRLLHAQNADCLIGPIGSIRPLVDTVDTQRTCLETCEVDSTCRDGEACKAFLNGRPVSQLATV